MPSHFKSNPAILNEARDYFDGLLLSDGSIPYNKGIETNRYAQSCKYRLWLDIISEYLYEYGIESSVSDTFQVNNFTDGTIGFFIQTYSYIEIRDMRKRWYLKWYDIDNYPKRLWAKDKNEEYFIWKKIVPKDICLSPICVANWYLGDGWITNSKYKYNTYYHIGLETEGFLGDDILFLSDMLSEVLDIKCHIEKNNTINISDKDGVSTFIKYIKDCYIPSCYLKKFPRELIE